ncbi:hypothetical protein K9L27_03775 [Candidatus Gracilibacteria bacterium]|nr:hypothetical protein [Candidatus Gracilibacteria bacterium]
MVKKDVSETEFSFWGEFWHGLNVLCKSIGKGIGFLFNLFWQALVTVLKLVLYVWGLLLLTGIAISLVSFLLSASIRQLSEVSFVEKMVEKSDPIIELYLYKIQSDITKELGKEILKQ